MSGRISRNVIRYEQKMNLFRNTTVLFYYGTCSEDVPLSRVMLVMCGPINYRRVRSRGNFLLEF